MPNKFSKIKDVSTKHVSGNIIMMNKIGSRNLQTAGHFYYFSALFVPGSTY